MTIFGSRTKQNSVAPRQYLDFRGTAALSGSLEKMSDTSIIRAKKVDGQWKLYEKASKSTVFERLSGSGAKKRAAARTYLRLVMSQLLVNADPETAKQVNVLLNHKTFRGTVQQVKLIAELAKHASRIDDAPVSDIFREGLEFRQDETTGQDILHSGEKTYFLVPNSKANGGFGAIDRYQNPADPKDVLVVKRLMPGIDESEFGVKKAEQTLAGEARAHLEAQGAEGHANIAKFHGGVRLPDGTLGMVMEAAPHGDIQALSEALPALVKKGDLSPEVAALTRLTLIRDMAEGMAHFHANKVTHGDFKLPNVMIGQGGVAKIIDFGTAEQGDEFHLEGKALDNPRHMAPEFVARNIQLRQLTTSADQVDAQKAETVSKNVQEFFRDPVTGQPMLGPKNALFKNFMSALMAPDEKSAAARITVDRKVDSWALGAAALQLLKGGSFFASSFATGIEEELAAFATKKHAAISNDGFVVATREQRKLWGGGHQQEIDLVNALMNADPALRPEASAVLAMPALQRSGVGSPEIRALIVAIGSGAGEAAIKAAANAAKDAYPPVEPAAKPSHGVWARHKLGWGKAPPAPKSEGVQSPVAVQS